MYLTNRDIRWAIDCEKLIVNPRPEHFGGGYDETSIDLHLGPIEAAFVWDIDRYRQQARMRSARGTAELDLGSFQYLQLAAEHLIPIPEESEDARVCRRGNIVIVRPGGFFLWATKEVIGTPISALDTDGPKRHPELICFVNAKSTRARMGLLVHFTAPTIHAGWSGNVTLEIANLGPFDLLLHEDAAIAQLTVATISSAPDLRLRSSAQQTQGQTDPSGAASAKKKPKRKKK